LPNLLTQAGPGLSLGFRRGAGSLGQVAAHLRTACASLHLQQHRFSSPQSSRLGFPKGITSDHHAFAETRKGAPTNWAGTPDGPHLDLPTRFAKRILSEISMKSQKLAR
jgi:hypothetical protein